MNCTRCDGEGFLNLDQIPEADLAIITGQSAFHDAVLAWIKANDGHDVSVCDCCGDGQGWYGEPGQHHYNPKDPCCEPFPGCF